MESRPSPPPPPGSGPLRIPEAAPTNTSAFATDPELSVIDSPISPASPNALARFEFETGRGHEGSKILMVEWDPSLGPNSNSSEDWLVSWDGKGTTFPVSEKVVEDEVQQQRRQRVYFLLPSNATVPPAVTIEYKGIGASRTLTARSMPAIFAPGLGVGTRDAGRRGVLHTIWARLRAQQLQDEIRAELADNSESVGLEMAVQERLWIIDHFGLDDLRPPDAGPDASSPSAQSAPTQRSPVAGRLGEKLRGLKLATSPAELAYGSGSGNSSNHNPLGNQHHNNPHLPRPDPPVSPPVRREGEAVPLVRVPIGPDAGAGGVASLDAILDSSSSLPPTTQTKETEDELFALPMSPRSPEMKAKSPFSCLK
ncbi:uncharacterized protein F4822DRAFT_329659 [Hypoxylon trugodes]|uniref:uncharacterized protein n=1 Tax=Hypoxylon trugodes TaxID=326681 RepID=UPI0021934C0E|nr:uncharacterized protein F4822DRAFT_329659 [Hypoxylon trugodes]KAI1386932.1 hypothetical protein F4822DRAFT_329659 [Hypoxylon trugodes]